MRKPAVLAATLATFLAASVVALSGAPAVLAQDTEERAEGKFRLTLDGSAPENVSFRVEANVGGGGVICTTDADMVETGIPECRDGGEVNEMSYSAPVGSTIEYRIVGSQGVELSQETVAEGSTTAENGFVVDASYTFSGEPIGDEPSGTKPDDTPSTDDGAAGDQYENDSSGSSKDVSGKDDSGKEDSEADGGVLPDTGGSSVVLVAGAALLLAAGGFLAYRAISQ